MNAGTKICQYNQKSSCGPAQHVVLHRFLQALAAVGALGGGYLMFTQDIPLPLYVAQHPEAVWLVGPLLAAITGAVLNVPYVT
jgi:hypothetical protein